MLSLTIFVSALLSAFLSFLLNIKILKRKLKRWDGNSTIYFIMSLTNGMSVNKQKKERWKVVHGYNEEESATILRSQTICLIEMLAGFVASAWLLAKFFAPKP